MTAPSAIIGAGLAGLLAAHAWPNIPIIEAASERHGHKALLRFRSDAVSRLTGIEFRPVTVRKGVWVSSRGFVQPNIALANLYAQKVVGELAADRSIWSLEPVTRWIAPDDFYERLIAFAGSRVRWGQAFNFYDASFELPKAALISTVPLPVVMEELGMRKIEMKRSPITVTRFRIPRSDVFQTVYFPEAGLPLYRASITGDLLIVETVSGNNRAGIMEAIEKAFGIGAEALQFVEQVEQQYGKIIPLNDDVRKSILFKLSHDHGIFSLGRFAQWRNILLDDVIQDIAVIKRLLNTDASKYDLAMLRT